MKPAQFLLGSILLVSLLLGSAQAGTISSSAIKSAPKCPTPAKSGRCDKQLSLNLASVSPRFALNEFSSQPCAAIDCANFDLDSSGAAEPKSDTKSDIARTPGPSDRTGYYLLGSIPLIVGVGSLLGIDHRLPDDNSGIWKRNRQLDLAYAVVATEIGGALWNGGQTRLGRTFWESIDSSAFSSLTVQGLKYVFSRARPYQSSSPHHWFQGGCCQSFPSGEVTLQASFVTPFIIEYHRDHPWVWGLEALPLYDSLARMKTQGHWQTDVLSGWVLGTAFGIFAHNRKLPFFLSIMPHSVMVGWHTDF